MGLVLPEAERVRFPCKMNDGLSKSLDTTFIAHTRARPMFENKGNIPLYRVDAYSTAVSIEHGDCVLCGVHSNEIEFGATELRCDTFPVKSTHQA